MGKKFYGLSLLFALCFFLFSFSSLNYQSEKKILRKFTSSFHHNLDLLNLEILEYQIAANKLNEDPHTHSELKKTHYRTRMAFKRVEFLLEYFDHESVKYYLNGAPLLSLEPKVPEILIVEPVGLQVLDETVLSEDVLEAKEDIQILVKDLTIQFPKILKHQKQIKLQHRHIFEAVRQELVRIFTLGVTGFDTPGGSSNAIAEAKTALESLSNTVEPYFSLLPDSEKNLVKKLKNIFESGIEYLNQNQDFETFNRLEFLIKFINPLYKYTLHLQKELNIETIDEAVHLPHPVNYEAENIFDNNFLNPNYYANLSPKELSRKRTKLGKTLFFDPILSANNQRACASCHQPEKAFTDGMDKSLALNGQSKVNRNSPGLINSIFSDKYFYDLRESDLERQIKHVVLDSLEFGTDFFEIVEKINQSEEYQQLFEDAFPNQKNYQISKWSVSNALACYVADLHSFNSPFDQYVRNEIQFIEPAVERGFNLFMGKAACGTCHFAPVFNGSVPPLYKESESEVLGVPMTKDTIHVVLDSDAGRVSSSRPTDRAWFYNHSFKTVSVRNTELTAPYMHNGVYHTLEEVLDFYNKGGGNGLGLTIPNQTLPDAPLGLTQSEISDLIAFMKSLTDIKSFIEIPTDLPKFEGKTPWNQRKIGGEY
jgi:cytochrome c peroxidase